MRWILIVVGGLLVLMGAIWTLQGLNILLGSPMSGDSFWAIAGVVTLLAGAALAAVGWRRRA